MEITSTGRGLDSFFSIAKYAITKLVHLLTAVITQPMSVITPEKLRSISRRTYLDNFIARANAQPEQLFKNKIDVITTAHDEPAVVSGNRLAASFETIASHHIIVLLLLSGILGYSMYANSSLLFSASI